MIERPDGGRAGLVSLGNIMNNTDLIDTFRESLLDRTLLLPTHPGPPELGGPTQQHLTTHFKLEGGYEKWAPIAMLRLAQMVNSFPGPYQFYQLDDPLRGFYWQIIWDLEIEIREYQTQIYEEWTEPAENFKGDFKPRKRWDDHVKVVFEVVFQFSQQVSGD